MSYWDHDQLGVGALREFAESHPDLSSDDVALAMTRRLTKEQLRSFAIAYVVTMVDGMRRARAREVEDAAEKFHREQEQTRARIASDRVDTDIFNAFFADPCPAYSDDPRTRHPYTRFMGNAERRRFFRCRLGHQFDEWYERGLSALRAAGMDTEDFEADWHPDGVRAYYEERRMAAIRKLIDQVAEDTRLETTRELLNTFFALGDGTRVTWGEATVEQHRKRVELLTGNAAGNVETAARHLAAIRMIEEGMAVCLADVAAGVPA